MIVSFDEAKSEKNRTVRGLPFDLAQEFDFSTAIVREDIRISYGEHRYQAIGDLLGTICFLVFTPTPDGIRVISLRLASRRERSAWSANQPGQ